MVKPIQLLAEPKLREIAQTLLQKTKAGQVNWIPGTRTRNETTYELILPESRVALSYISPTAESDFIQLQLQDAKGTSAGSWSVEEPDWEYLDRTDDPDADATVPDWKLLKELFEVVHRYVTGWDKVIRDVEAALASQGPIGQPARPESPSRK
ncbi:MAG: hypothetical protein J0I06_14970 [Planctomycetes bacterium]|nr:hypothetical protein [Planctomycetota bacterium]